MDNKLNFPHDETRSSLGFFGIIKESINTARTNAKLLVPILLVVFVSYSQLDFADEYILTPLTRDFLVQQVRHLNSVQKLPYSLDELIYVGALRDLREILVIKLIIMAITWIISLVFMVATVSSSSEAYTAKAIGPKDVLLKIKKSWKRPIVTTFYMFLLILGYLFLYMIFIGITSILAVNSWAIVFLGATCLFLTVFYFYVATLEMVSYIVSILEEGVSGFKAIGRASELMKGRRLKASLMMVLFAIAYGFVLLMTTFLRRFYKGWSAELVITVAFRNWLYCLLEVFMYVVFTVFYHDWNACNDEKEGKGYVQVATNEV